MLRIPSLVAFALALAPAAVHAAPPPCPEVPAIDSRCETWTATYDNPNGYGEYGWDGARTLAMSPDGATAYVTGFSHDDTTGEWDIVVVAFNAATGAQRWATRHDGAGSRFDDPMAITTDRSGQRVFLTGVTDAEFDQNDGDFVTIALDASTGAKRWVATYGTDETRERPSALAVDPAGERLYVTGATDPGTSQPSDLVLQALDTDDGSEIWSVTYDGIGHRDDEGEAVVPSPDGSVVYVGATSWADGVPPYYDTDMTVLAYEAGDPERLGELLWEFRYDGGIAEADAVADMALSPDASKVYVAGASDRAGSSSNGYANSDMTTVAVGTADGQRRWVARTAGASGGISAANDVLVTPDDRIVVVGNVTSATSDLDWEPAIAVYRGADGSELWSATAGTPGSTFETFESLTTNAAGTVAYATGFSRLGLRQDVITRAFGLGDGAPAWSARYNGGAAGTNFDMGNAIGVGTGGVVVAASLNDNLAFTLNRDRTDFNYADIGVLGYAA